MAEGDRRSMLQSFSRSAADAAVRGLRTRWPFVAAGLIAVGLAATLLWRPRPLLLWNASASSQVGLFAVATPGDLRTGDMVVAWAPVSARHLAALRHYLPRSVPLVKPVAAVRGSRVCALRRRILIDGRLSALRRRRDPSGRLMPWWSGCRVLGLGEVFLLSPRSPDAFDGRYFGVTQRSELIGRARLLWPRSAKRRGHG